MNTKTKTRTVQLGTDFQTGSSVVGSSRVFTLQRPDRTDLTYSAVYSIRSSDPVPKDAGTDTLLEEVGDLVDLSFFDEARRTVLAERDRLRAARIRECRQAAREAKVSLVAEIAKTKALAMPVVPPVVFLRRQDFPPSDVDQAELDKLYKAAKAALQPVQHDFYQTCWRQALISQKIYLERNGTLVRNPQARLVGTRLRRVKRQANSLYQARLRVEKQPGYAGQRLVTPDLQMLKAALDRRRRYNELLSKFINQANATAVARNAAARRARSEAIEERRRRLSALYRLLNSISWDPKHIDFRDIDESTRDRLDAITTATQLYVGERRASTDHYLSRECTAINIGHHAKLRGDRPVFVLLRQNGSSGLTLNKSVVNSYATVRVEEHDESYLSSIFSTRPTGRWTGSTAAAVGRATQDMLMKPARADDINLLSELIELRDLPSTFRHAREFFRWGRSVLKGTRRARISVKGACDAYLEYLYGVRPTVEFASAFLDEITETYDYIVGLFNPSKFNGPISIRRRGFAAMADNVPTATILKSYMAEMPVCLVVPLTRSTEDPIMDRIRWADIGRRRLRIYPPDLLRSEFLIMESMGSLDSQDHWSYNPEEKWVKPAYMMTNKRTFYELTLGQFVLGALEKHPEWYPSSFDTMVARRRIALWSDISDQVSMQDAERHFIRRSLLMKNSIMEAGWNQIPFSFMVDWFFGVQSFMKKSTGYLLSQFWASDLKEVWASDRCVRRHLIAVPSVSIGRPRVADIEPVSAGVQVGKLSATLSVPFTLQWRWECDAYDVDYLRRSAPEAVLHQADALARDAEVAFEFGRKKVDPWRIVPQIVALGIGARAGRSGFRGTSLIEDMSPGSLKMGRNAARIGCNIALLDNEIVNISYSRGQAEGMLRLRRTKESLKHLQRIK